MQRRTRTSAAGAAGDPVRAGRIIVDVVHGGDVPTHLLLGTTAVDRALAYSRAQLDEADRWAEVSRSADFANAFPVAFPLGSH